MIVTIDTSSPEMVDPADVAEALGAWFVAEVRVVDSPDRVWTNPEAEGIR